MKYFDDLNSIIDKINPDYLSAWSTFGSLVITVIAVIIALKSLNTWKTERKFDLEIELKSKMSEALTILNKLNKTSFVKSELDNNQIIIIEDLENRFNDNELITIQTLQSGYHNHFFQNVEKDLVKLRQVSMKAITYNRNKNIRDFYILWSLYEGEIFNTIYNYCFINLNIYSSKYNFPHIANNGNMLPLPRFNTLVEQGHSQEEAIQILFNNLKTINTEDDYTRMLNIYRETYFPLNIIKN